MAYANVNDIQARWRELTADEAARANALLEDAAILIDAHGTPNEDAARVVSCNMVIRAMSASGLDAYGVSQSSMTAGPYTQSWTYSNPSGDMYLTKAEKKMLGFIGSYIGSIRAKVGCDD